MASPPPATTPCELLAPLFLRDLGQTLEGDVFQVLKRSPYIVRSLEFALADGCIDCTRAQPPTTSFAERLWHMFSFEPEEELMSDCVLFDIKSESADDDKSHQVYKTVKSQRRRVGFWICISAHDPSWVDVIPNRQQDSEALQSFDTELEDKDGRKSRQINAWRDSRLHEAAHGFIDPCASPYRMPISTLPEAIFLIRQCALGLGDYINPHTKVTFHGWRPIMTRRTEWLKPSEGSAHYTAYLDAWDVFKGFRTCGSMVFDLVGLQPCLADFKLLRIVNGVVIQTFIQAKGEGSVRGQHTRLTKVRASRQWRYYFDVRDRHDYFYFTFEFASTPPRRVAYFFPERVVPDHFYTCLDRHVDFTIPELEPYCVEIDDNMDWVRRMEKIIQGDPKPRRDRSHLPPRPPAPKGGAASDRPADSGVLGDGEAQKLAASAKRLADADPENPDKAKKPKVTGKSKGKKSKDQKAAEKQADEKRATRKQYRDVMVRGHRRFFYSMMRQCATRGQGLLIELARNGRDGDFGYCRYRWTESERRAFIKYSHVPAAVHGLPHTTPLVCIFYYCRHRESWYTGPKIAPKHYERLNLSEKDSIIFWDISGPDVITEPPATTTQEIDTNRRPILAIVPSGDVQPSLQQKASIESSIRKPGDDWEKHTPSISGLLNTGHFVTEYTMPRIPLDPGCDWSAVWTFLDNLTVCSQYEHPAGLIRDAQSYRHTLQEVNQRLAEYWDVWAQRDNEKDDDAEDDEVAEINA